MENKTEKLKVLIGSSTILTPYERVEWLSLLELMNDKQLAELEKILTSVEPITRLPSPGTQSVGGQGSLAGQTVSKQPSPSPQPSPVKVEGDLQRAGSPVKTEPVKQPLVMPLPKLSHIMNLPHIGGMPASQPVTRLPSPATQSVVGQGKSAIQQVSRSVDQQVQKSDKKKSGFASKLKAIFAEKELPAGKTYEPLELIAGQPVRSSFFAKATEDLRSASQQVSKNTSPSPSNFAKATSDKQPLPTRQAGFPVKGEGAKQPEPAMVHLAMKSDAPVVPVKTAKPAAPLPPNVPMPPVKTIIQPVIIPVMAPVKIPEISEVVFKQEAKPNIEIQESVLSLLKHQKPKSDPNFNPGVNFEKASEKSRSDDVEKIKQHMAASGSAKGVAGLGKDPTINNLKDLAQISLIILKESSETGFVNKIKLLITKFGYFQVIFNIEESPAYKAYIATGLKLLTEGSDFNQLNDSISTDQFLDKDSFEKFADVLAKIQAS